MPSAYITQLNRELERERDTPPPQAPSLSQAFVEWYESLPEVSRQRAYSITEMEQALHTQGKYLSPILLNLGWQRKRKWTSAGQYPRYWVPPPPTC